MAGERFPADFVWGAATAAYQIEGAVREDGRGVSIWDTFSHTPGKIADGTTGDVACDSYHRYGEDIGLLNALGMNAYRFSIAWPRIVPLGAGPINQAGLDHYSRMVDALLGAGLQPFVTLYHWDLPQPLEDRLGWGSRATATVFAEYADIVVRQLGDRVTHWATLNEPWCSAMLGYYLGVHAPGHTDLKRGLEASHNLLLGHGLAVQAMRAAAPQPLQIGIVLQLTPTYPASDSPEDVAAARRFDGFVNRWFLDPLAGRGYPQDMLDYYGAAAPQANPEDLTQIAAPLDWLGVNYYERMRAVDAPDASLPQAQRLDDPDLPHTADREVYPEGLYDILLRLHNDYPFRPLYITENGCALHDEIAEDGGIHDGQRQAFFEAHLAQLQRALAAGVPLKGYFAWSLLDNFEWAMGLSMRYGICYTNFETLERRIKDSGYWLRDFIAGQRGKLAALEHHHHHH
uniref:BETA-GLUCOSIDASE n=1 Tax=metagenomes TaxID=408169 RepID=UPI0007B17694